TWPTGSLPCITRMISSTVTTESVLFRLTTKASASWANLYTLGLNWRASKNVISSAFNCLVSTTTSTSLFTSLVTIWFSCATDNSTSACLYECSKTATCSSIIGSTVSSTNTCSLPPTMVWFSCGCGLLQETTATKRPKMCGNNTNFFIAMKK